MKGIDYVLLECKKIETGTNRKIYGFKCLHCNKCFENHKNAVSHVKSCNGFRSTNQKQQMRIEDAFGIQRIDIPVSQHKPLDSQPIKVEDLDPVTKHILMHFCECNIPISQIDDASWHDFIHFFSPETKIPCRQTLTKALELYPEVLKVNTLHELADQTVGLAVDGASFRGEHYYAFILICIKKIRLLEIKILNDQTAATISNVFKEVYDECKNYNIKIASVVTDNGSSIKAALTKDNPLFLRAKIGDCFFWVSCAAHTSQLALKDFLNNNIELKGEVNRILTFAQWLRDNCDSYELMGLKSIPKMVETRWNTFVLVLDSILSQKDSIQKFVIEQNEALMAKAHRKNGDVPNLSPVDIIPNYWNEIRDAFYVVKTFTDDIEGDLVFHYNLWVAYCRALNKFDELSVENDYAKPLKSFFMNMF